MWDQFKKDTYNFQDFKDIIEMLRSENGCPWDKEQTHDSLNPCIIEEAAELVASVRIYNKTGNPENMKEELGDILLQVMLHSQIAKEEGLFELDDVIQTVCEKMIRRHPHVFGLAEEITAGQVEGKWEEIKKKEKEGKDWVGTPLRDIPLELPALARTQKILKKADKVYNRKLSYEENLELLEEAVKKLKMKQNIWQIESNIGDILFAVADLARMHEINVELLLSKKVEDFIEVYEN